MHALALSDIDLMPLTHEEWSICEQLCEILEPFHEVTNEISSEKYLIASKVIPITHALKTTLTKSFQNITSTDVKLVSNKLLSGINERFPMLENSKSSALCTLLDPRYKHHLFKFSNTVESTKKQAIELVTGLLNQGKRNYSITDDKSDQADEKPRKSNKVYLGKN